MTPSDRNEARRDVIRSLIDIVNAATRALGGDLTQANVAAFLQAARNGLQVLESSMPFLSDRASVPPAPPVPTHNPFRDYRETIRGPGQSITHDYCKCLVPGRSVQPGRCAKCCKVLP